MTAQKYLYECSPSLAEKLNNHLLRRMVEEVMQEYAEHYHSEKLKELLPSEENIDAEIEKYSFQIPYDGSNKFYDETKAKSFKDGANFVINKLKS